MGSKYQVGLRVLACGGAHLSSTSGSSNVSYDSFAFDSLSVKEGAAIVLKFEK
jgi:hypothetical protein